MPERSVLALEEVAIHIRDGALTRGQLARRTGVGIETVRFYERKGLLEDPPRTRAGYRMYDEDAVRRLRFIRRAKELGFTLGDIRELISLRLDPDAECADVQPRAEEKLGEITEKIRDLKRMAAGLEELVAACEQNERSLECPLLEALEEEEST